MSPADLEDFCAWTRVEREGKRYRKRTYKRFTAWICEEPNPLGYPWWIIEDVTGAVLVSSDEGAGEPPQSHEFVHVRARSVLTPAQTEAMLNPLVETMYLVVQVRRTGEIPQVPR